MGDISKSFRRSNEQLSVLESVSLSVRPNELTAIVGGNGSGKSTLLKIAVGHLSTDNGSVSHNGCSIAYMPQDYRSALFPWLRLSSNTALYLDGERRRTGGHRGWLDALRWKVSLLDKDKQCICHYLEEFGLPTDLSKYPAELSGGEQQLFLFLLNLTRRPQLFIADEPLSAIDLDRRQRALDLIGQEFSRLENSLLFVSHNLEEAVFLADRVIVLSKQHGSIAEEISIESPRPRPFEWKFSEGLLAYVKQIEKALRS